MALDVILTLITLVVAVIGTLLKAPSMPVKVFLIALAVCTSVGSVVKAHEDTTEKAFLKSAITSNLVPNGKVYRILTAEISSQPRTFGFDSASCYHDEGMTCFLASNQSSRGTVVFSRSEIAQLYANHLQHGNNSATVAQVFRQKYSPQDLDEDFEEKAAILGAAMLYRQFQAWPNASYDDHAGQDLELESLENGKQIIARFTSDELRSFHSGTASSVFYAVEQALHQKLSE
jgi:hypothetical protein